MINPCKHCKGTGKIEITIAGDRPDSLRQVKLDCPICMGTGFDESSCPVGVVKLYSSSGKLISQWDNVVKAKVQNPGIYLELDNDKLITIIGGIIVTERGK